MKYFNGKLYKDHPERDDVSYEISEIYTPKDRDTSELYLFKLRLNGAHETPDKEKELFLKIDRNVSYGNKIEHKRLEKVNLGGCDQFADIYLLKTYHNKTNVVQSFCMDDLLILSDAAVIFNNRKMKHIRKLPSHIQHSVKNWVKNYISPIQPNPLNGGCVNLPYLFKFEKSSPRPRNNRDPIVECLQVEQKQRDQLKDECNEKCIGKLNKFYDYNLDFEVDLGPKPETQEFKRYRLNKSYRGKFYIDISVDCRNKNVGNESNMCMHTLKDCGSTVDITSKELCQIFRDHYSGVIPNFCKWKDYSYTPPENNFVASTNQLRGWVQNMGGTKEPGEAPVTIQTVREKNRKEQSVKFPNKDVVTPVRSGGTANWPELFQKAKEAKAKKAVTPILNCKPIIGTDTHNNPTKLEDLYKKNQEQLRKIDNECSELAEQAGYTNWEKIFKKGQKSKREHIDKVKESMKQYFTGSQDNYKEFIEQRQRVRPEPPMNVCKGCEGLSGGSPEDLKITTALGLDCICDRTPPASPVQPLKFSDLTKEKCRDCRETISEDLEICKLCKYTFKKQSINGCKTHFNLYRTKLCGCVKPKSSQEPIKRSTTFENLTADYDDQSNSSYSSLPELECEPESLVDSECEPESLYSKCEPECNSESLSELNDNSPTESKSHLDYLIESLESSESESDESSDDSELLYDPNFGVSSVHTSPVSNFSEANSWVFEDGIESDNESF